MREHLRAVMTWPPPYKLKRHRLAKRVKLKVSRADGLVIIVPPRFRERDLADILLQHQSWIVTQLQQVALLKNDTLPDHLYFPILAQRWSVFYEACHKRMEMLIRPNNEIVLIGRSDDKVSCKKILVSFAKQQASLYLPHVLRALADKSQFNYQTVTIRDQTACWGSCNTNFAISLNYKLLWLPSHIVNYVLVHELCHTVHLNHSRLFWDLVAKHDIDYKKNRAELKRADQLLPTWL